MAVSKLAPEYQKCALDYVAGAEKRPSVAEFRKWIAENIQERSTSALPAGNGPDIDVIARDLKKYMQRDPATAKPQERQRAHDVGREMMQAVREYYRKWGIDE